MEIRTIDETEYLVIGSIPFNISKLRGWKLVDHPAHRRKHKGNGNICASGTLEVKDKYGGRSVWLEASSPIHEAVWLDDRLLVRTANSSVYWLTGALAEQYEELQCMILAEKVAREYGGK